jgi:hypothetical protein
MLGRSPSATRTKRGPRWGVRTMLFLILAFVAIFTAQAMDRNTVGTFGSLVLGLGGAAYCSIRGVREARARGLAGLLATGRRRR